MQPQIIHEKEKEITMIQHHHHQRIQRNEKPKHIMVYIFTLYFTNFCQIVCFFVTDNNDEEVRHEFFARKHQERNLNRNTIGFFVCQHNVNYEFFVGQQTIILNDTQSQAEIEKQLKLICGDTTASVENATSSISEILHNRCRLCSQKKVEVTCLCCAYRYHETCLTSKQSNHGQLLPTTTDEACKFVAGCGACPP